MSDLLERISAPRVFRTLCVVTAALLVISVASVGQIQGRIDAERLEAAGGPAGDTAGSTDDALPGDNATPGEPNATDAGPDAATQGPDGSGSSTGSAATGGGGGVGTKPAPAPGSVRVPDFGLRTQGVTAKEVKLGITYNVAACGDAGTLEAAAGAAVVGDAKKANDAYVRHVNENGGVGGRTLKLITADDGGGGCSEKALAAARQLVDDEKVFAVIPGLHDVADYVASKKIPTFTGRDDPASLKRYGANGVGLTQEIEGNLTAWAAFGKHYLETGKHKACLLHPESGDSGDWATYEKILLKKMSAQGLSFTDIVVYKDDVATAQEQASSAAVRMKSKGCDQVWFMAGNPIAGIFFTQAATQSQWFPTWTFTSYMALADTDLGGRAQDQRQWENAIGLSTRVPPGVGHPKEGNCKRIYEKYYPGDGQSESAYAQLACALVLSAAETMRRGIARTGVLTANSLIVGADSITNDFYYDAHVPLDWKFPAPGGPFKSKAWSHYTVIDWNSTKSTYDFPEYPKYWEVMGPGKGNSVDLRPYWKNA